MSKFGAKYDKVNKNEVTVQVEFTNQCNLSCSYCVIDKCNELYIDLLKFKNDLTAFVNLNNITSVRLNISGGEPFIERDKIFEFIKMVGKMKIKIPLIHIFSNGTLLRKTDLLLLNHFYDNGQNIELTITWHYKQVPWIDIEPIIISRIPRFHINRLIFLDGNIPDRKIKELIDQHKLEIMLNTFEFTKFSDSFIHYCKDRIDQQKNFFVDDKSLDILDFAELTNGFRFKSCLCDAGFSFLIYSCGSVYRCVNYMNQKKNDGFFSDYKISKVLCPFDRCICEQSILKVKDE